MATSTLEKVVLELHEIGVVKFGSFTLKSGMQSPVYFDLRIIVSYPKLLESVSELLWEAKKSSGYQQICGVPYTALPIATVISTKQNLPMLIKRKESKSYGTKKIVEGVFKEGEKCLIIEDVIVSGSSVYETVETLRELNLACEEAVVFLDREQGGSANLAAMGINATSVVNITQVMQILHKHGRINQATVDSCLEFINSNNDTSIVANKKTSTKNGLGATERVSATFEARISTTNHPLARKLLEIMVAKKTNLCIAADVSTTKELITLADNVGPHVCIFKTHIDIISDFSDDTLKQLQGMATKHNFMLMEDRKFGDIGATVANQYSSGVYKIVEWADLVTVHALPGDGVIKGLVSAVNGRSRGCVLVAEMSSQGALTNTDYVKNSSKIAEDHTYFVMGFVAQGSVSDDPRFLLMTPGVQMEVLNDNLGQQYVTPHAAVMDKGADIIIVGRGITKAEDQVDAAVQYKEAAYNAYLERVKQLQ
ncbi:unnamed protein product [Meganyctiphanes norvegica]|uniref:Uridine 5'-monophosphate synthase n=1 Tax=Meganyctiphanes norvegica TaxID=48144 RepID=A0AAV2PMS1_MEGNR